MILDSICDNILVNDYFLSCDTMRINELVRGDTMRLVAFGATDAQYRRKLLSLGVTCGVEFTVVRIAPLGCPVQIEVRGTSLTLRKDEASQLVLERV